MKPAPSSREQLERLVVLLRRALAFWKRGLVVFLVGVLISVPFVFTRPRSYRSETIILYQETIRSADVTGGEGGSDGARRVGARLRELLLSRASLEPIIKDFDLYPTKRVRGDLIEAVEEMRKNIVFRAQEGDAYEISFTAAEPKEAQEVTQRLADCIIQETTTNREGKAKTLKEFLTSESARNEIELRQKEADLARFVAQHQEFGPRLQGLPAQAKSSGMGNVTTSSDPLLSSLETRAARIERQLAPKTATSSAAPKPSLPPFQPPSDSGELVAARRELTDKLSVYTENHPDVIAARSRLKAAEQAQASVNEAAAAAYADRLRALQLPDEPPQPDEPMDEASLRKELASLRAQIGSRRFAINQASTAPSDGGARAEPPPMPTGAIGYELDFRRMKREVDDGRDRQQELEGRLFRASLAASSVMDDRNVQVSILDPAYMPVRPVSKPRSILLGALLLLSLALGLGTSFLSASIDDRIYDRQDIERLDILPVIAIIPKASPRQLPPST